MAESIIVKQCVRCKLSKSLAAFHRNACKKDGRTEYCAACISEYKKISAGRMTEETKLRRREWQKQYQKRRRREWGLDRKREEHSRRAKIQNAKIGCDQEAVNRFFRIVHFAPLLCCYWCGQKAKVGKRHVDHIVPLSRGGHHDVLNLCCSCAECNLAKRMKLPEEFNGQFLFDWGVVSVKVIDKRRWFANGRITARGMLMTLFPKLPVSMLAKILRANCRKVQEKRRNRR